jgi:hypothetical protein
MMGKSSRRYLRRGAAGIRLALDCRLLALCAITLVCSSVIACGETRNGMRRVNETSTSAAGHEGFRGDADYDSPGDNDNDKNSNDEDSDTDGYYDYRNSDGGYYDSDDRAISVSGRPVGSADEHAIATLVERYYAAGAAGNGVLACSLVDPVTAKMAAEAYGRAPGPLYLRGAKNCQAIVSRLFQHIHNEVKVAVKVADVRTEGERVNALVGSKTMPSSFVVVRRVGGEWKVGALIGTVLP